MRSMTREMNCDCRAVLMCRRSALVPDNNGGYCTFEVKKGVPNIRPPPLCRSATGIDAAGSAWISDRSGMTGIEDIAGDERKTQCTYVGPRAATYFPEDLRFESARQRSLGESNGDRQWELEKDEIRDKCLVEDWKVGQADGRGGRLELVSPMEGTFCGCKRITAQTAL
ncbi:hypothetical protein BY996DRAFT_6501597 [Phakopsora pachyrhizi]|nr:hypothetical protein BY996DRAFT_6501597 [Phakopsora pachyrhizi]